jgi:predicted transcriptional regulator
MPGKKVVKKARKGRGPAVGGLLQPQPPAPPTREVRDVADVKALVEGKLKVSDMVITDEFILGKPGESAQAVCKKLIEHPRDALLIEKDNKILGIINVWTIIQAIAGGNVKLEARARELMVRDIMEVPENALLEELLPKLYKRQPAAVVVTDKSGKFKGYFSPEDCRIASMRLKIYE